jgi:hypothetical protein
VEQAGDEVFFCFTFLDPYGGLAGPAGHARGAAGQRVLAGTRAAGE